MLKFALKIALALGIAGAAASSGQAGILGGMPESTLTAISEALDNTVKAQVVVRRPGLGGPAVAAPRRGPVVVAPRGPAVVAPRVVGPGRVVGPARVGGVGPRVVVRPWVRRPYFGTIVGGIALGAIIAATAYAVAPPPPAPGLCWYWADEAYINGYWDYC